MYWNPGSLGKLGVVSLTLIEAILGSVVPGEGMKGDGANSPLCSGCFPGSDNRIPTCITRLGKQATSIIYR